MGLLHIYDSSQSDIVESANKRSAEHKLPVTNVDDLKGALDGVKNAGKIFDRILFETHGEPGKILFNHKPVNTQYWQLIPGRYNTLTAPFTRIYFNGCNVAEDIMGWRFLEAVKDVFMNNSDGEVFAQTSWGFVPPFSSSGHTIHLWGSTKVLYVKGGRTVDRSET
jgi:hypothetical protein